MVTLPPTHREAAMFTPGQIFSRVENLEEAPILGVGVRERRDNTEAILDINNRQ